MEPLTLVEIFLMDALIVIIFLILYEPKWTKIIIVVIPILMGFFIALKVFGVIATDWVELLFHPVLAYLMVCTWALYVKEFKVKKGTRDVR